MATLILQAVGTAIAGPIGGIIGSIAGGFVDRAIFGSGSSNRTVEGPRLQDLSVQSSAYGRTIPLAYGTVRLAGNVIMSTGLIETRMEDTTTVSGGKGGGGSSSVTNVTYSYAASFAVAVSGRPIHGIGRIWADGKLLRAADGVMSESGQLRIYTGGEAQLPDTALEAELGVGNVSAHRGLAYVVFQDLQLAEFANRIPNLTFEVIADVGETLPLSVIVRDICQRAGLSRVDVSDLTQQVRGMALAELGSARAALERLARTFAFDTAEVDGVLVFQRRPRPESLDLPSGDLAAHLEGQDRPAVLEEVRAQELELPKEVRLIYSDPARDYQYGTQRARRVTGNATRVETVEPAVVMQAGEAKQAAEIALADSWVSRTGYELSLGPKHAALTPGDVVGLTLDGARHQIRIERVEDAGPIRLEGRAQQMSSFVSDAAGDPGSLPDQTVNPTGETVLQLLNLPALVGADAVLPVYYAAANGTGALWRGAVLYVSSDGGQSYRQLRALSVPAVMGTVREALPSACAAHWDEVHTLTVDLLRDEDALESLSALQVCNGGNAALIGDEILQFREAQLQPDGLYQLSGLLRGRRGTEADMHTHQAGDRFVLLTSASIAALENELDALGKPWRYKAVAPGQTLDDAPEISFAFLGNNLRPYAPVHLWAQRLPDGALKIGWTRRSRIGGAWSDGADVPLGEAFEAYELDVLSGETVLRTLTSATPEVAYTAADQIADFGALQSGVQVRLYQLSDLVGRGFPATATL